MALAGGVGFGIVGIGGVADTHAAALRAMTGGRLVCAYSRGGERADRFARDHEVSVYTDEAEFLRHPGLDAVLIATPSGAHLEPAVRAAAAGKHVLCEKPLEVTLGRCDAMIEACRRAGVRLGGVFQCRWGDGAAAVRAAIAAGRLGRLTMASALVPWYRSQAYYDSAEWRGTWALDGGGASMNQAIHTLDLLLWFCGPVVEVAAFTECLAHERIEVEDVATATLRFESGALGVLAASTAAWPGQTNEIAVSGTRGTVRLSGGHVTDWSFAVEEAADESLRERLAPAASATPAAGARDPRGIDFLAHQRQFEDFAEAVARGREPAVDGAGARRAVETVLALYASARERRAVSLPQT